MASQTTTKQLVIHFGDYDRTLPTDSSSQSKKRRRELFDEMDPAGNGILQQAAVVRALFRLFPRVAGITDTRALLNLCFHVARDTAPPIVPMSVASIDRNEFRVLMICMRCYLKAWEVWYNVVEGARGHDGLLRLDDIGLFTQLFEDWGCRNLNKLIARLRDDFRQLDAGNVGALHFDKFADAALRRTLPYLSLDTEGEEMAEAKRLLKKTHDHLFTKEEEARNHASRPFAGGVSLALCKRPAREDLKHVIPGSSKAFDGQITRYMKNQGTGWSAQAFSQYNKDFAMPNYTALKRTPTSLSKLHESKSQPSILMSHGLTAAGGMIASPSRTKMSSSKSVKFAKDTF